MKLAVVAMVRNETDIVGAFLRHLDALFDYALLMDHQSTDGTGRALAAACAQRPGWTLWHLEPVGYHQPLFTTFALRHVLHNTDADFVFLLDVDEFIDTPGRAAFETSLAGLTDPDRIGMLAWRNVVPERFDERALGPEELVWLPPSPSIYGKAIIPRPFYLRHGHEVHLAIGNHGLYYTPEHLVPWDTVGDLLHLPVRSHTQIKAKVVAGVFSIMAQAVREAVQGRHWFDILDRMADGTLRDEDLIGIATRYGEPGNTHRPVSRAELRDAGYRMAPLAVPFGRDFAHMDQSAWMDPTRLIANILRRYRVEDARANDLVLEGDRVCFVPRSTTAAAG
jgi:hypothetical protein